VHGEWPEWRARDVVIPSDCPGVPRTNGRNSRQTIWNTWDVGAMDPFPILAAPPQSDRGHVRVRLTSRPTDRPGCGGNAGTDPAQVVSFFAEQNRLDELPFRAIPVPGHRKRPPVWDRRVPVVVPDIPDSPDVVSGVAVEVRGEHRDRAYCPGRYRSRSWQCREVAPLALIPKLGHSHLRADHRHGATDSPGGVLEGGDPGKEITAAAPDRQIKMPCHGQKLSASCCRPTSLCVMLRPKYGQNGASNPGPAAR
jgi:hypothetical protein